MASVRWHFPHLAHPSGQSACGAEAQTPCCAEARVETRSHKHLCETSCFVQRVTRLAVLSRVSAMSWWGERAAGGVRVPRCLAARHQARSRRARNGCSVCGALAGAGKAAETAQLPPAHARARVRGTRYAWVVCMVRRGCGLMCRLERSTRGPNSAHRTAVES